MTGRKQRAGGVQILTIKIIETLPMEKKNSYRTEKDEIGGMEFCFYEII